MISSPLDRLAKRLHARAVARVGGPPWEELLSAQREHWGALVAGLLEELEEVDEATVQVGVEVFLAPQKVGKPFVPKEEVREIFVAMIKHLKGGVTF